MATTYILGVSALFHDAAAVLVADGKVVAAAQEERFTRVKHDASLPVRAAAWCLATAGITANDLTHLVFYEKPLRKFERILTQSVATFPRGWRSFPRAMHGWLGDKLWLRDHLVRAFGVRPERLLFCEHHRSHAASAFFASPYADAAVLTLDGVGEDATTALWRGRGARLEALAEVRFPHSLGLFYSAITAFLGFAVNEGEYKVMGMAAFGTPRYREAFARTLRLDRQGGFSLDLDYFAFHWDPEESYTRKLVDLLGPPRFPGTPFDPTNPACRRWADIAASAQAALEDAILHLARYAHATVGTDALCLAGGVALNAVANGRLAREGPFRHVWVQPAAGDDGGALGAALWAWHEVLGQGRASSHLLGAEGGPPPSATPPPEARPGVGSATVQAEQDATQGHPDTEAGRTPGACLGCDRFDLGRSFDAGAIRDVLDDLGARYEHLDDPVARAVEDLAGGQVIGWFEGRGEWGPRALGHRSILADPRDPSTRDRVNAHVKHREPFRPFAPSVTAEGADAWFDVPAAAAAPVRTMLTTVPVRGSGLGAVTHVDGSARVQVVDAARSPVFHDLLARFGAATGVPVLLNTSFNVKGDPIASTPLDALATMHRGELDVAYLGPFRVERPR
jgi:carbamoyltransferase